MAKSSVFATESFQDIIHRLIEWENSQGTRIAELLGENVDLRRQLTEKEDIIRLNRAERDMLEEEHRSFMSVSRVVNLSNENSKLKERIGLLERNSRNKVSLPEMPTVDVKSSAKKSNNTLATSLLNFMSVSAPAPAPSPVVETDSTLSEPSAPEPSAPEPSAPEPSAPEPSAPEPSAPEPSAPEPSAPEPSAPEPSAIELDAPVVAETSNEEHELEVYEKKIKGVVYYIGNDDVIYECLEDGEIGDAKGSYIIKNDKRKIQWY